MGVALVALYLIVEIDAVVLVAKLILVPDEGG